MIVSSRCRLREGAMIALLGPRTESATWCSLERLIVGVEGGVFGWIGRRECGGCCGRETEGGYGWR